MSMALCSNCGCLIDTDAEPEAFYRVDEDGNETELDNPECVTCREGVY